MITIGPERTLCLLGILLTSLVAADDVRLEQSRDITDRFGAELKAALIEAMSDGGPVAAIGVCKDVAPAIASRLSSETGAKVSRISLKYRNPLGAPDADQRTVLENFEKRAAAGETMPLESFESSEDGTEYLKAIVTQPLCLACHGQSIASDVREAIDANYPFDRAGGYEAGDIRGAFSVVWPESVPAR